LLILHSIFLTLAVTRAIVVLSTLHCKPLAHNKIVWIHRHCDLFCWSHSTSKEG